MVGKQAGVRFRDERSPLAEASSPSVQAAWDSEIRARVEAYERGELKLVPAEDVIARARKLAE